MRALPLVLVACFAAAPSAVAAELAPADLVLRGGDILTQDPAHPHARAVAVRGGVIVAVGDDVDMARSSVRRRASSSSRPRGGARAHRRARAPGRPRPRRRRRSTCAAARRPPTARSALSAARGARPAAPGSSGAAGIRTASPTREFPTHAALDASCPIARSVLERVDGHAGWANARGDAARAGITRGHARSGGRPHRARRAGEPTGVFVDNAMALVERARSRRRRRRRSRRPSCAAQDAGRSPRGSPRCTTWASARPRSTSIARSPPPAA